MNYTKFRLCLNNNFSRIFIRPPRYAILASTEGNVKHIQAKRKKAKIQHLIRKYLLICVRFVRWISEADRVGNLIEDILFRIYRNSV